MFKHLDLSSAAKQLIPAAVLTVLLVLAGKTNVFSDAVHKQVAETLLEYLKSLAPLAVNLAICAIALNIAYVLYHPLVRAAETLISKSHASPRGQNIANKAFKLFYWVLIVFTVLTLYAPEFVSKIFVGVTMLTAAVALALKDAANDFVCGVMMQFSGKMQPKEDVAVMGIGPGNAEVRGTVVDVGYFSTNIETDGNVVNIPNREIWARPIKSIKVKT